MAGIWRYPVKSVRGESLDEVRVEAGGLTGDRAWACVDDDERVIGSAKHPRRWGGLLQVSAAGEPAVIEVDRTFYLAGEAEADEALSAHLGHPVHLTSQAPEHSRIYREIPSESGMVPDWLSDMRPGQERIEDAGGFARTGRFVDFAPIHLVTTGALADLEAAPARFRPNLLIETENDPEPGDELTIGDLVLKIQFPTPRCIVPSLAQGDLPADPGLLRTLAKHYRRPVFEDGRKAACFGVYADVLNPGDLRVGSPVQAR